MIAEIIDKQTKKSKPGILFLEAPFKDVVVMIQDDGQGAVLNAPRFVRDDKVWKDLLQKRIDQIMKML